MSGPVTVSRVVPWPFHAEDCLEALHTSAQRASLLSPAQLRKGCNLRTLLEVRDFIETALDAAGVQRGNCDG
jgi:hypothetical protein